MYGSIALAILTTAVALTIARAAAIKLMETKRLLDAVGLLLRSAERDPCADRFFLTGMAVSAFQGSTWKIMGWKPPTLCGCQGSKHPACDPNPANRRFAVGLKA